MSKEYAQFKKTAAENNTPDVTEDEYEMHAVQFPKLSLKGKLARIRNSRKGAESLEGKEVKTVLGYFLGSYDFVTDKYPLHDAKMSKIHILTKNGIEQFSCWNEFVAKPGRQVEIEVARKPETDYWDVHSVRTHDESWRPERWSGWKDMGSMEDLDDGGQGYPIVALKGMIRGGSAVKDRHNRDDEGGSLEYEVNNFPGQLCVSPNIRDGGVDAYVSFGPYKNGKPLVRVEDWDPEVIDTLEDFRLTFKDRYVGIIGTLGWVATKSYQDKSWKRLSIDGFCIVELPEPEVEDEEEEEVEETVDTEKVTTGTKTTSSNKEKALALLKVVREGYAVIGEHATAEAIHQSYAKDFTMVQVEIALKKIKAEAQEETETVSGLDLKKVRNVIKRAGGKCTLDFVVSDLDGKLSEDKVDACMEHLLESGEAYEPDTNMIQLIG